LLFVYFMIFDFFKKPFAWLLMCGLVSLCSLSGCAQHNYKKEADEQVYKIIDEKWQEDFGSKANYKTGDTGPSPNDLQVERAVPASGVLTLPQAVAIATDHNREYQTQKESLYIMALDLRLVRHDYETRFFSGGREGYGKDGADEGIGGEADVGFERLLASGARIGTKVGIAWFKVLTGDIDGGLASILSATVTQPLLRGRDPRVVRENLTQAERSTLYQVRAFNRFRKVLVVSIISQYYRVLQLSDAVKNAEENYNTIDEVYERLEKLSKAGRVPQFEMERIGQDRLQAFDTLVLARRDYEQALDEFKLSLSLPTDAEFELDAKELEALRAAMASEPDFAEEEVIETALYRRLDVANSADAVIDAQRKVYVAADGLRGDLDLFVGVDATSLSGSSELGGVGALDDDLTADRGRLNPLRRLRDNNPVRSFRDQAEIGIDWEMPLDRVVEQNIYRKALIAVSQRQREYEQVADTVKLEVRQAYRELTAAAERYRVQLEALELARKRFKNTLLLVQYGRASSRRVLNAQRDLFDAQNAATEALVDYSVATLNFYRDTGVLEVRPDGMWEHGVYQELRKMAEPRLRS
jgi:outer membrane protein TolC